MNSRFLKKASCFFTAIICLTAAVTVFASNRDKTDLSTPKEQTVEKFGVTFQFQKCKISEKKASCYVEVTSHKFDKRLAITTSQQILIDNSGNKYSGSNLIIGDKESSSWLNSFLKADMPTRMVIHFNKISANSKNTAALEIVGSLSKHGESHYAKIRFSDIPFSQ